MESVARSVSNNTKQLVEVNAKLQEQLNQGGVGGGATEAKQDDIISELAGINFSNGNIDNKISNGNDATLTDAQQVLVYGRDSSGGVDALKVDNQGHLEVVQDAEQQTSIIFSGTQTINNASSHTFPTTLDKNGSTKYNLLILSTTASNDIEYSVEVDVSDDNSTFYTDANSGGMGTPSVSQIQNAQLSFIDQTTRYARITILNNSLVNLTITSIKATKIVGI